MVQQITDLLLKARKEPRRQANLHTLFAPAQPRGRRYSRGRRERYRGRRRGVGQGQGECRMLERVGARDGRDSQFVADNPSRARARRSTRTSPGGRQGRQGGPARPSRGAAEGAAAFDRLPDPAEGMCAPRERVQVASETSRRIRRESMRVGRRSSPPPIAPRVASLGGRWSRRGRRRITNRPRRGPASAPSARVLLQRERGGGVEGSSAARTGWWRARARRRALEFRAARAAAPHVAAKVFVVAHDAAEAVRRREPRRASSPRKAPPLGAR